MIKKIEHFKTLLLMMYLVIPMKLFSQPTCFQKIDSLINDPIFALEKNRQDHIKVLIQDEIKKSVFEGDFKHYIHAFYLQDELERIIACRLGVNYEIHRLIKQSKISKNIDHEQYIKTRINISDHVKSPYQKILQLKNILKYSHKTKVNTFLIQINDRLASTYFNEHNYKKAIFHWDKCYKLVEISTNESVITKASFLNNVAVTYEVIFKIQKALMVNKNALRLMSENKMDNENYGFYFALLANRAYYYKCLNKFEESKLLFEKVYIYRLKKQSEIQYLPPTSIQLYQLKKRLNEPTNFIIKDLTKSYYLADAKLKKKFYEFFIEYYKSENDFKNAFKYYKLFSDNEYLENQKTIKQINRINTELEKEKIEEIKLSNAAKSKLERSKFITLIIIFFFVGLSSVITLFFSWKNFRQKAKIIQKEQELDIAKKEKLENELKFQKEQNMNLELNLAIKSKSEFIFLDKLKEIRRKKNNDTEEIIKELQFQIMNLLQIDEKSLSKRKKNDGIKNKFTEILKGLNKNLSEHEIQLCYYFKMNLSAKEISQLEPQITTGSIRTIKNRIKNKLELGADVKLDDYLNGLC